MEILKQIEESIIEIRNQKVIIDSDVALLYGVETKRINEAVKNNLEKFPEGYVLELSKDEKNEVVEIFDHLHILKFSSALPKAFTEKGLYMLATILKSPQATQTTIAIIETFTKIRELGRTIEKISLIKSESDKKSLMQKGATLITELFENDLQINETETTIELNFAVLKL